MWVILFSIFASCEPLKKQNIEFDFKDIKKHQLEGHDYSFYGDFFLFRVRFGDKDRLIDLYLRMNTINPNFLFHLRTQKTMCLKDTQSKCWFNVKMCQ